jgi:hypothetical protein
MTFQKNIAGLKKNKYKIIIDKFLEKIKPVLTNNNFFYFQVDLNIFKFNIVIDKHSFFLKALSTFYNIKKIKNLDKNFTIFCVDHFIIKKNLSLSSLGEFETYRKDLQNLNKYKSNLVDVNFQYKRMQYINLKKKFGILYARNYKKLPKWEINSPFRLLIHILALSHQSMQLHGSALLFKKKGIVILGDGGAGKSTTAINAVEFYNAKTAGDDYFLFCGKTLKVFAIHKTVKFKNKHPNKITFLNKYKNFSGEKGKTIYFCNSFGKKGIITNNFFINKIIILSQKNRINFFDLIKSTILQMPYWPEKTIKIAVNIFKNYDYEIVKIKYGKKYYLENLKKILSIK